MLWAHKNLKMALEDPCNSGAQGVAWIDPDGRWFTVPDGIGHGTWALQQVVFRGGLFSITGEWRKFVRDKKAIAAVERCHRGEPARSIRARFLSVPHSLRKDQRLLEALSKHGVAPGVLPEGIDEYDLIFDLDDLGSSYQKVVVVGKERPNPEWALWDAARRDLEPGERLGGIVSESAYLWMLDSGWVRVANLWNLSFHTAPTAAMDTWCEKVLQCIRSGADVERLSVQGSTKRTPLVDFVEDSCSPSTVSKFWEHLSGGLASRVAAKYDPYAPQSVGDVLQKHLHTMKVNDEDDLNLDVTRRPSQMGALMNRARQWSLDEFTTYMERFAWVNRIDELRKSLAAEPLEYRVMVNGKAKAKGTSEANLPRLREHLVDYYKYEKWADKMEIVTRPRPKADYAKLDALLKAQAERERAWADLYADLRVPKPVLVEGVDTSDTMSVFVEDRGVRVGGIYLSKEDHTSDLTFTGCEADIRKLVAQYGDGPVWTVPKSTLWPEYRGKGTGIALYLRGIEMLRAKGTKPVYLEAHHCLQSGTSVFGTTSEDALRVWKKLTTRFPSSGTVIAIV